MTTTTRLKKLRPWVQALTFILFLSATVYAVGVSKPWLPPDTLMRLDPLAALAAMLASRRWLVRFVPALVLLVTTLVLGRFWCSWLCPLGTLLDWFSPRKRRSNVTVPEAFRGIKYGLLLVILFAALWGNLSLLIFDPLTIFMRSVTTWVLPGFTWLVNKIELALYPISWLRGGLNAFDTTVRGTWVSYSQPYYASLLLAALVGLIVALNWVKRRAWCRYLCPLGGLLALVSKVSWLKRRVSDDCVQCGACSTECSMGTITPEKGYASDSGECILCLDCEPVCPKQAISFGADWHLDRGWSYDPSRRQLLGSLGAGVVGVALLKAAPTVHHPRAHLLRPPGATEQELMSACVRCGACMRVCPTHGLQPSVFEAGLEGFWTPILVPRLGHCEFWCTACGEACPTGAIPRIVQSDKLNLPIGKAYIDPHLCIPWSGRGPCIVCEEMCPLPEKAIVLEEHEVTDRQSGQVETVQVPVVLHEQCIGCGLCENNCPVNGEAAIRVIVDPLA